MRNWHRVLCHEWPLHTSLLLANLLPDNVLFYRLRGWMACSFFGSCGRNIKIGRSLVVHDPMKVHFGNDVFLAYGCCLLANDDIWIDDEVMFGPYCVVSAGNHTRLGGSFRYGPARTAPIRVGKGCWIGAHATLTAGVTIGPGSLVGAGAVVTKDIPSNVIAAGVPARVIKDLPTA